MDAAERIGDHRVEALLGGRADHLVARARRPGERPVVLKASRPGTGWATRAELRREARILERVAGTGVVVLLDVWDRRRTVLVLELVAGGPAPGIEDGWRHDLEQTLAGRGVVHRAITLDHVLLDADARPVLVGFGNAEVTYSSRRRRSSSVSRRTTTRASPSFTKTTGGRGTLL